MVHCYYAEEKGKEGKPDADRCFFIRAIVREGNLFASDTTTLPSPDPKLVMNALGERVLSEVGLLGLLTFCFGAAYSDSLFLLIPRR